MKISIKFLILGFTIILGLYSCKSKEGNTVKKHYIDAAAMDTNYRPQDDFFMYVNGNWIKNAQIPPSEVSWGSFNILREKSFNDMHFILDSLSKIADNFQPGSLEQLTADFYLSGMDTLQIDKTGITPLMAEFNKIDGIETPQDILKEIARENISGSARMDNNHFPVNIVTFYAYQDDKNSEKVVAHFDQGSLGLPTRDYYFPKDSSMEKIKKEYTTYIGKILTLLGSNEDLAAKNANLIVDLETKLAEVSKSPAELRDPVANYNKFTVDGLDKKMTGIKWKEFTRNLGITEDTVLVGQPLYYKGLNRLLYSVPLDTWKQYLKFRMADNYTNVIGSDFDSASFNFYGKILIGQKEKRPRWKRMCDMVNDHLGDALGQIYVRKFFPPEAKERMIVIVDNLQKAYQQRILQAAWMDSTTKQKAIEKLSAIIKKIGYPDNWQEYKGIVIDRNNIVNNLISTNKYHYDIMIGKIGKPVDKTEWLMTPPTVNAYYNPYVNEIVFPAGILQPPFFDKDADDAINYGAIGLVIGHEITHGFDDQGRQYDAKGNMNDWWTKEDAEKFNLEAKKIIDQYNKFTVLDSLHLNGELTQGENIADLGGLIIAFNAFKMTPQGQSSEKIDGFTPEQRFFISYAIVWQTKRTDEITRQLVYADPHSPPLYRVNGPLSNMPDFYKAFNIQPGDKLYCPDSLQVKVW
jgi:putative endopeptidase